MSLTKPDPKLFYSRNDPLDPRLGESAITDGSKLSESSFAIVGYPDDAGIEDNKGRIGAKFAPDLIRKYFYKMTPPLFSPNTPELVDLGNLDSSEHTTKKHEAAIENGLAVLKKKATLIGIGGGHDYAYCDGSAFLKMNFERPLIINFDAHLDVRPNTTNSGSSFRRLLETFNGFDIVQIGIQSQCNSRAHLEWFEKHGGRTLSYEEILNSGESFQITASRFLESELLKPRPTYISVDIDAFSSSYAPGCSQSFSTGLDPTGFFQLFDILVRRLDVKALGIYEVSPPLDVDDRTSKLAALIMHRFIQAKSDR